MPHHTTHDPGTFCWVDLATPDVSGASAFYGQLLGWQFTEPNADFGGYSNASKDGELVAGLMPMMAEGQPSAWTLYLGSDDADRTAQQIKDNGGQLIAEPMDVADLGRMIIATDPVGAVFGVWQPGTHTGFGLTEEPGGPGWFELWSSDHDKANDFYATLFGYQIEQLGDGDNFDYTVLKNDAGMVGGTTVLPADAPGAGPSHWLAYFIVADADAAVQTATDNGGVVVTGPQDSPYGRMAVLQDPYGASFAVITMMEQPADA